MCLYRNTLWTQLVVSCSLWCFSYCCCWWGWCWFGKFYAHSANLWDLCGGRQCSEGNLPGVLYFQKFLFLSLILIFIDLKVKLFHIEVESSWIFGFWYSFGGMQTVHFDLSCCGFMYIVINNTKNTLAGPRGVLILVL